MNKYARYFALEKQIRAVGYDAHREDLIELFTDGSKRSLKQLSETEYREFCTWLSQQFIPDWQNTPSNKMRRKIIGLFKEMDYTLENGKADMEAINQWCIKHGKFHKPLQNHTQNELQILTAQAEKARLSFVRAIGKY